MRNVLALTILGLAACGSSEDGAERAPTQVALPLSAWTVRQDPSGAVTHFEGRSARHAGEPVESALAFLTGAREALRLSAPRDQLRALRVKKDDLGMTHVRFAQVLQGIPVMGAEMMVHFAPDGAVVTVDSTYVANLPTVPVSPSLSAAQAVAAASSHFRAGRAGPGERSETEVGAPVLMIRARAAGAGRPAEATLAYRFEVRDDRLDSMARVQYTVDARSGAILEAYDDLETVTATGKGVLGDAKAFQVTPQGSGYVMLDTTRTPAGIRTYTAANSQALPGNPVLASVLDNAWDTGVVAAPGSAVDAHAHAGLVYDFYRTALGRSGIDGSSGAIVSTVHYGTRFNNAFWNGRQMVYGDGDNVVYRGLAGGADVVAHELTHGVTQSESALEYQNQPGALNEALSDIFAAFFEASLSPDPVKNWQVGEAIGVAGPLRDMAHPALVSRLPQPTHMCEFLNITQDNGGVHLNSGIVNNAAYLMVQGGANDHSKMAVPRGLGVAQGLRLWYRVATQYLMATSNFTAAADATRSAARDLGFTEDEMGIIESAWTAVGVVAGTCSEHPPPEEVEKGVTSSSGGGHSAKSDAGPTLASDEPKVATEAPPPGGCSSAPSGRADLAALGFIVPLVAVLAVRRRTRRRPAVCLHPDR
jgi:Zn-dependent metalloprotease